MTVSDGATTSANLRQVRIKAVGVVIAAGALVVGVAVLVWLAAVWEADPSPSSSVGTSGALRGWLAVAAALIASVATVVLAWFARRVPEGVSGLLRRLDDAEGERRRVEASRQDVETQRDTLATRLSRPYLHGEALPVEPWRHEAEVRVGEPLIGGMVAPSLQISLPRGRLPQVVRLSKEECREWYAEIELAEREAGGVAVIRYLNVALVATVNAPHDDETGASIALFPHTTDPGPQVAFGVLRSWPQFREAVKEVAMHRLPSLIEFQKLHAKE